VGNTCIRCLPGRSGPVHPHACGEHITGRIALLRNHGSSPRMWGTLRSLQRVNMLFRFIPTHVGNTNRLVNLRRVAAVHPHACGEHSASATIVLNNCGSSPRMWGTLVLDGCSSGINRFIPTHVGNTQAASSTSSQGTVHPHACGEHNRSRNLLTTIPGSSPRMWGTRLVLLHLKRTDRFIPTHVGNTCPFQSRF